MRKNKIMRLSKEAINQVSDNMRLRNLLAAELNKSEATIRRWADSNHPMLTTEASLKVIEQETGLARKKILSEK